MAGDRDDALSWDGDDDPTLDVGATSTSTESATAIAAASQRAAPAATPPSAELSTATPGERAALGSAALVSLGVLGGVYLLFVVGWAIGGLRLQRTAIYLAGDVMFQASLWLSIVAPVLWFVTVSALTRRSRAWVRFVWLLAGAALLVPWPFVITGVVGL